MVVGASLGGPDALTRLVADLPADLPASVFVVQHLAPGYGTSLPELLSACGPLHAALAVHGEAIVPGRIYVAPPDNHLGIFDGHLNVTRGPKENGHRPSIDTLFRTASRAYGPRVVGVVLTGRLDCGTAGLMSIKARGGVAVVQDPAEARAPEMPSSAIAHVAVDHVVTLPQLGPLIARLVAERPGPRPSRLPDQLAELEGDRLDAPSELVCPACDGNLTTTEMNGFQRFSCHVGHAFSLEAVTWAQAEQVERALWSAVRALDESAALSGRLAGRASGALRSRFAERERSQREQAQLIRDGLLRGAAFSSEDALLALGAGWPASGPDPGSTGGTTMTERNRWKGDAVAESPEGESEAAADRVAGREPSAHPRQEPPPDPGRYQPKKSTPEDDREIQAEKQEEAIEQHADDRANGTGTAPKNL